MREDVEGWEGGGGGERGRIIKLRRESVRELGGEGTRVLREEVGGVKEGGNGKKGDREREEK